MDMVVNKYLDEVLKPQLLALMVSEAYIDEIYGVVSEQMNSALYHWQEMKNVFITLTREGLPMIHNVNGEEKLNLVMLDDSIPAGAKLY